MTTQPLNILVFEGEYLIALDIQTVLTDRIGCRVAILPISEFPEAVTTKEFDVAMVNLSKERSVNLERARMVEARRRGIVFTTSFSINDPRPTGAGTWPIVEIPFTEHALVQSVRAAASRDSVGAEGPI